MATINFQFDTQYGTFSDALILDDDAAASLTPEQITAMQQERLNNWVANIENPIVSN